MDERQAWSMLEWYEFLEKQVIEFAGYIPLHSQNMKTWSPRLATVIVEACGLIDSLLRHVCDPDIEIKGKKREDFELSDLAELYCNKLKLPDRKAILLTSPPEYRVPFDKWSDLEKHSSFVSPTWWATHNKLKHDRVENIYKATLDMAVNSLAGLIIIIGNLPHLAQAIVRKDWIDSSAGWTPDHILEYLGKYERNDYLVLMTNLFAVILGDVGLPHDIKDFKPFFYASKRLAALFAKLKD